MISLIDNIAVLKQKVSEQRQARSRKAQPFHWYYLKGFAAAIHAPFEIREARARLHYYQNVPIAILPGEAIVGQLDWNEPLATNFTNTHVREDVLERILKSDILESEKHKIQGWIDLTRPYCFNPIPHLTPEEKLVQDSHLAPSTLFNGHVVADFGYLLKSGFQGILADIHHYRERKLTDVEGNFYDAMEITVKGLRNRYFRTDGIDEQHAQDPSGALPHLLRAEPALFEGRVGRGIRRGAESTAHLLHPVRVSDAG